MRVPNLHKAPKRYSIKIKIKFQLKLELFLGKLIFIWKNINSQDVLKGLHSTKFLKILNSKKTRNKFSTDELKITFKHPKFVRKPFKICSKIRTPPGF